MASQANISDQQLKQYQQRLREMRDRMIDEVDSTVDSIHGELQPEGDQSNAPIHLADDAPDQIDANIEVIETERKMMQQVQAALERIEQGTYGQCVECGQSIAPERLEVLPDTPLCISCAKKHA